MAHVQWFPSARRPDLGAHAVIDGDLLTLCGQTRAPQSDESTAAAPGLLVCGECSAIARELTAALRVVNGDAINAAEVAHLVDPQPESMDLVRQLADAIGRAQAFKAAVAEIPGVEVE